MNSGYNLHELLSDLKTDVKEWVEIRLKLLQLHVFEKTAILGSFLIFGIIVINLLFFAFLFAFFALSFLIGKWVNSVAGGFAIVGFLYLLMLALTLLYRNAIFTGLQNLLLKTLNPEPDEKSSVL